MKRKRILSKVDIDTYMFITSFEEASQLLLEQKEKLEKEGWTDLRLELDYYFEGIELIVMGMRFETDAEYKKRLAENKKKQIAAQKKEERERKMYEKLKMKYEQETM